MWIIILLFESFKDFKEDFKGFSSKCLVPSSLASSALVFYIFTLLTCFKIIGDGGGLLVEWAFRSFGLIELSVPVLFDWARVLFSLVVRVISLFVFMFRTSYMSSEKDIFRFVWLVVLFVFSMNFLIFVPSYLGLILGWDGLGLVSFLLVAYYNNERSLGAGLVTAFINRVGDVFLVIRLCLLRVRGQ